MRIEKAGVGTDEVEFAPGERVDPVTGEIGDDFPLARMDGFHVGPGRGNLQAEGFPLLREVQHVGHVKQRLRRHAAAQDAEAAELARAIDDGGAKSERGGGPGRVEPGTAAAEHEEVVGFHVQGFSPQRPLPKSMM